jgi:hypothetical protein
VSELVPKNSNSLSFGTAEGTRTVSILVQNSSTNPNTFSHQEKAMLFMIRALLIITGLLAVASTQTQAAFMVVTSRVTLAGTDNLD